MPAAVSRKRLVHGSATVSILPDERTSIRAWVRAPQAPTIRAQMRRAALSLATETSSCWSTESPSTILERAASMPRPASVPALA